MMTQHERIKELEERILVVESRWMEAESLYAMAFKLLQDKGILDERGAPICACGGQNCGPTYTPTKDEN